MTEQPPELAPTLLTLKAYYAALLASIFGVSALLALLLADSGLTHFRHAQPVTGTGLLLAGLFVLGIGTLLLIPALAQLRLAFLLETTGQVVEGTVLEKRLEKDKKGHRYCFILFAIDSNFRFKQAIPQEIYQRLEAGDQVKVRCLPRDASIARLENPSK